MELKDCYKILGVTEDMSMDEIHTAYLKLAKKYHPDLYDIDIQKMWAAERFIFIDSAYKTILNTYIKQKEERKLVSDLVDKILEKMEYRTARMDEIASKMDPMFYGAAADIGILFGIVIALSSVEMLFGIILVPILLFGLFKLIQIKNKV